MNMVHILYHNLELFRIKFIILTLPIGVDIFYSNCSEEYIGFTMYVNVTMYLF